MANERTEGGGYKMMVKLPGVVYEATLYWAMNSAGAPSIVIAIPMGASLAEVGAVAALAPAGGTAEELLDYTCSEIAQGAVLEPLHPAKVTDGQGTPPLPRSMN